MVRHDHLAPIQEGLDLSKVFLQNEAESALWNMGISKKPYASQVEILNSHCKILAYFGANRCLGLETEVRMVDGEVKLIRDMVVGDKILAFDFTKRDVVPSTVDEVYHNAILPQESDDA